jgi:hypothetical protein
VKWRDAQRHEASAAITRIGGQPTWLHTPRWPVYRGRPLAFFGQLRFADRLVLTFLSPDEAAMSYESEGGGNAAIIQPGGDYPDWVRGADLAIGPRILATDVVVPAADFEMEQRPRWIQGDETPAIAPRLICQIAAEVDLAAWPPADNFGYMYFFRSDDWRHARMLWQS